MSVARLHRHERDRLDSLASYGVLGAPAADALDRLTALAARTCRTPSAAVNLIGADQQWPASACGTSREPVPRAESFCSDVVADGQSLVVPDATRSARYRDNPHVLAGDVRAYAGVPLVGRDGLPLGALCVFDSRPRRFTGQQLADLGVLAGQTVALLELWRSDAGNGLLPEPQSGHQSGPQRPPRPDGGPHTRAARCSGAELRAALDAGELVPHYQPVVDLQAGRTVGLEALLRWEHPRWGTLPPAAFLPAVEASALVVPVGRAVLEAALTTLNELDRDHPAARCEMAVNVAGGQLARPGLAADVRAAPPRRRATPPAPGDHRDHRTARPGSRCRGADLARPRRRPHRPGRLRRRLVEPGPRPPAPRRWPQARPQHRRQRPPRPARRRHGRGHDRSHRPTRASGRRGGHRDRSGETAPDLGPLPPRSGVAARSSRARRSTVPPARPTRAQRRRRLTATRRGEEAIGGGQAPGGVLTAVRGVSG